MLQLKRFIPLKLIPNSDPTKLIMDKIKETAIENEDILAPAVETALEIRKNKNTLVPALKSFQQLKKFLILPHPLMN